MNHTDFNRLFEQMKNSVDSVAKDTLHDYLNEAKTDGQNALQNLKNQLQQWAQDVENQTMTPADVAFLLKGEEALGEMRALKQAGLAAVHLDQFRDGLINMILNTVTGFIKV